jgi:1-acyl-sn-glycerol-3-phosphate acyltransferase
MTMIRSLLFAVWLYGSILVVGILGAPWVFASRKGAFAVCVVWAKVVLFGARWIAGIRWEVRGAEHLPEGPVLIASKHQGMLDTIVPFIFVDQVAFVAKKELLSTPVFGWYCRRAGMIAIDRSGHMSALKQMVKEARERLAEGRSILIFPEGTRQAIGAPPDYKPGVAAIYGQLGVPCVPMALNTGLVWPAHGLKRTPGLATFEFLPAIPPGLKRDAFMHELETRLEVASAALLPGAEAGS